MMIEKFNKAKEIGDFLKIKRQIISPSQVGLPEGMRRRTPGLRREEVASLANVGVSWYTWLEQGRGIQVSSQVLLSIAKALQLNIDETNYILNLSGFSATVPKMIENAKVSPMIQHVLDAFKWSPSVVLDAYWNIIAWNKIARYVFCDFEQLLDHDRNLIELIFLNPDFKKLYPNWENKAKIIMANFRLSVAQMIEDKIAKDFIESMMMRSPEFKMWWYDHDIKAEQSVNKIIMQPDLGKLVFEHTSFTVDDAEQKNLKMYVNTPKKGSYTEKKLSKIRL